MQIALSKIIFRMLQLSMTLIQPKRLFTVLNTAFAKKYKDPQKYSEYVLSANRRQLSDLVASKFDNKISKGGLILDLAAGTGISSESLVEHGYKVLATDHYEEMLKQIPELNNISKKVLDYNKDFSFEENYFDGVSIIWGNRYVLNVSHFLDEVYRVLKPGGYFVWPVFTLETPMWFLMSRPEVLPLHKNLFKLSLEKGFESEFYKQKNPFDQENPGFIICRKPA